jgi:hypothetical protein
MYEYRAQDKNPRLKFRGSFPEFLRWLLTDMAHYFAADDDYTPEYREIARLYGITLPGSPQHGEQPTCLSPSLLPTPG